MEVHHVEIFGGRSSAGDHFLDAISDLTVAPAEQSLEKGNVRCGKSHHRNAERSSLNLAGAVRVPSETAPYNPRD